MNVLYAHMILGLPQNTSQPIMSRLQFTQSVIESLASTYLTKRNAGNNVNPQVRVKKLDGRKERDCVICSDRKRNIRRRSRTSCARCTRRLHAACLNASQVAPKTTRPFFQDKSPTNLKRSRSHKISSSVQHDTVKYVIYYLLPYFAAFPVIVIYILRSFGR
jgi:hypothetical protein